MIRNLIITFTTILFISSCSVSPSYDVYIQNNTDEDVTIEYKSDSHTAGPIEEKVTLKPKERTLLLSTIEIKKNNTGRTTASDCSSVAEYINVFNNEGKKSSITWCSDAVQFAVVDLGQGEFTIDISADSFDN